MQPPLLIMISQGVPSPSGELAERRNLGTFASRAGAERHERAVQYFERRGLRGTWLGAGTS
jgi:hypothetical protein